MATGSWPHASHNMTGPSPELKEGEVSQAEQAMLEDTVWRKLDRRLLPLCICLYVLAGVDQANIGNARVAGMQLSLNMTNYQFTLALTATGVCYLVAMFPPTLLLKRIGPHIMLPSTAVLFGTVSAAQGSVSNFSGALTCRVFLGLVEGGLFAGIVLYLSFFYPRKRLHMRIAIVSASTSLCMAFSGLLAAAISDISSKSGRPGWAWIFILEGVFTIVLGIIFFFLLPREPEKAYFLTEKEQAYVISVLKHAGSVSEYDHEDYFSWIEVIRGAKSPHVWLVSAVLFFISAQSYGLGYFEPTIVAVLGYSGSRAQLMSVPPFATAFVLAITSAFISDRYQCRGYIVILSSLLALVGFIMFYASASNHVRYASLFFSVTGSNCAMPALTTWLSNNSGPYTRRATAVTLASIFAQTGGIFALWLLGYLSPAPNYTKATITFISMSVGAVVLSAANLTYLWRENRRKVEKRHDIQKEEEPKGLGDRSAWFMYSL